MDERQTFGVIVRSIGVGLSIYSATEVFYIAATLLGISTPSRLSLGGQVLAPLIYLGIGIVVMRRADWIVDFAYVNRGVERT